MTTKEQIIEELNRLPEERLPEALKLIQQLSPAVVTEATTDEVWQMYLQIEQEDKEVFQRLANS